MINRRLDIFEFFSLVSPHQEHARLDSVLPAQRNRLTNSLDLHPSLHLVQNSVGTALVADPQTLTTQFGESLNHLFIQTIGAGDAFERNMDLPLPKFHGPTRQPVVIDREYVVSNPQHVRLVSIEQPCQFIGDMLRLAAPVCLTKYLMAA